MPDLKFVNATKLQPAKSSYATRIPNQEWDKHETEIRNLRAAGKTREEILAHLSSERGFTPTSGQLQKKFEKWSLIRSADEKLGQPVAPLSTIFEVLQSVGDGFGSQEPTPCESLVHLGGSHISLDEANTSLHTTNEDAWVYEVSLDDYDMEEPCSKDLCETIANLLFRADFVHKQEPEAWQRCLYTLFHEGFLAEYHACFARHRRLEIWSGPVSNWPHEKPTFTATIFNALNLRLEAFEITMLWLCLNCIKRKLSLRDLCRSLVRCMLLASTDRYVRLVEIAITKTIQYIIKETLVPYPVALVDFLRCMLYLLKPIDKRDVSSSLTIEAVVKPSLLQVTRVLRIGHGEVADIFCRIRSEFASDKSTLPEVETFARTPADNIRASNMLPPEIFANKTEVVLRISIRQVVAAFRQTLLWMMETKVASVNTFLQQRSVAAPFDWFELFTSVVLSESFRSLVSCRSGYNRCPCQSDEFWEQNISPYVGALCYLLTQRCGQRRLPDHRSGIQILTEILAETISLCADLSISRTESMLLENHCVMMRLDTSTIHYPAITNILNHCFEKTSKTSFRDVIVEYVEAQHLGPREQRQRRVNSAFSEIFRLRDLIDATAKNDFDKMEYIDEVEAIDKYNIDPADFGLQTTRSDFGIENSAVHKFIESSKNPGKEGMGHNNQHFEELQVRQEKIQQLLLPICPSITSSRSSGYRQFRSTGLPLVNERYNANPAHSHRSFDVMSLVSSADAMSISS